MKKFFGAALGALAAFSLAACNGTGSGSTYDPSFDVPESFNEEQEITVTFWHTMGKEKGQTVLNEAIADFKELYPNITIDAQQIGGYDEVRDQVITNLGTRGFPNMAYCYPDHVAIYNESQITISIDSLIDDEKYGLGGSELKFDGVAKEDVIAAFLNEGKAFGDNRTYTLPFLKSTEALFYNVDFFEEHNLEVPETWDEMWALCAKIKEIDPNSTPLGIDSEDNLFITLSEQYGFDYTSATGDRFLFNNDGAKQQLSKLQEYYRDGYFITKATNNDSYTNDKFTDTTAANRVYMTIGSTGGSTYCYSEAFETGVAMYPQADLNNKKVISQGPSFCFFKKDDPQEVLATWLFAQFLLCSGYQNEFAQLQGYIPVTNEAVNTDEYQAYLDNSTANSEKGVSAKAAKLAVDQQDFYYTSPAFVGSSVARQEVGSIVADVLEYQGNDIAAYIADRLELGIEECEYQAS